MYQSFICLFSSLGLGRYGVWHNCYMIWHCICVCVCVCVLFITQLFTSDLCKPLSTSHKLICHGSVTVSYVSISSLHYLCMCLHFILEVVCNNLLSNYPNVLRSNFLLTSSIDSAGHIRRMRSVGSQCGESIELGRWLLSPSLSDHLENNLLTLGSVIKQIANS